MNLRIATFRILAPVALLLAALSLPLVAQSPRAVQEEGRVVWTNDNPHSGAEDGAAKEYVYWSNSEQRWKPVRAASPRALRSARAVASEVSNYIASRPELDSAESGLPKSNAPADTKLRDKPSRKGQPAAGSIYSLIPANRSASAAEIDRYITEAAARHHVDPNLVRALIKVESNFNPRAVSSKGAMGLMQLMPATARQYDVSNPFDAAQNVDAGVRHLKGLLDNFQGDVSLTLAAYNAGQGAVERNGGIPPYTETRNYVRRITGLMAGGIILGIPEPGVASASMPIEVRRDERGRLMISNTD